MLIHTLDSDVNVRPKIRVTVRPDGELAYRMVVGQDKRDIRDTFRDWIKPFARFDFASKNYLGSVSDLLTLVDCLPMGFLFDAGLDVLAMLRDTAAALDKQATVLDCTLRASKLYTYQREGVAYLATRTACGLFDEMGLGKTVQAISAIPTLACGNVAPAVVVCPASVKGVWRSEIKKWRPQIKMIYMAKGRNSMMPPLPGEVVIINYDILPDAEDLRMFELEDAWHPGTILIGDEIHAVKTSNTARTKKYRLLRDAILERGGKSYGLTGTPLLNRGQELGEVCKSIGVFEEAFGSWSDFKDMFYLDEGYDASYWGPGGGVKIDWKNPKPIVAECLARVSLRRHRADVLKDLPNKRTGTPISADPPSGLAALICDEALNNTLVQDALADLGAAHGEDSIGGMGALSKARKALASCKIPAMLNVVKECEDEGQALIVFSAHRAPIDILKERPGWITITGSTSVEKRIAIERDFQAGKYKGIAGTLRAMSEGLTLTHSHRVLFVDRDWTPARNAQAEDRACRIGQKSGVLIQHLIADHDLDRMIADLLDKKQAAFEKSVNKIPAFAPPAVEIADPTRSPMLLQAAALTRLADMLAIRLGAP